MAPAPARDFTVDDTHLYWLQPTPSDGSPISDEVPVAEDVRADETSVYFISFQNRTLSRRDAPR